MTTIDVEPNMEDALRKSKWALAHISVTWRREVGPLARKAYNRGIGPTDPALCDELAGRLEGFARTARAAAELAREEA
jgi:hypothetical protein